MYLALAVAFFSLLHSVKKKDVSNSLTFIIYIFLLDSLKKAGAAQTTIADLSNKISSTRSVAINSGIAFDSIIFNSVSYNVLTNTGSLVASDVQLLKNAVFSQFEVCNDIPDSDISSLPSIQINALCDNLLRFIGFDQPSSFFSTDPFALQILTARNSGTDADKVSAIQNILQNHPSFCKNPSYKQIDPATTGVYNIANETIIQKGLTAYNASQYDLKNLTDQSYNPLTYGLKNLTDVCYDPLLSQEIPLGLSAYNASLQGLFNFSNQMACIADDNGTCTDPSYTAYTTGVKETLDGFISSLKQSAIDAFDSLVVFVNSFSISNADGAKNMTNILSQYGINATEPLTANSSMANFTNFILNYTKASEDIIQYCSDEKLILEGEVDSLRTSIAGFVQNISSINQSLYTDIAKKLNLSIPINSSEIFQNDQIDNFFSFAYSLILDQLNKGLQIVTKTVENEKPVYFLNTPEQQFIALDAFLNITYAFVAVLCIASVSRKKNQNSISNYEITDKNGIEITDKVMEKIEVTTGVTNLAICLLITIIARSNDKIANDVQNSPLSFFYNGSVTEIFGNVIDLTCFIGVFLLSKVNLPDIVKKAQSLCKTDDVFKEWIKDKKCLAGILKTAVRDTLLVYSKFIIQSAIANEITDDEQLFKSEKAIDTMLKFGLIYATSSLAKDIWFYALLAIAHSRESEKNYLITNKLYFGRGGKKLKGKKTNKNSSAVPVNILNSSDNSMVNLNDSQVQTVGAGDPVEANKNKLKSVTDVNHTALDMPTASVKQTNQDAILPVQFDQEDDDNVILQESSLRSINNSNSKTKAISTAGSIKGNKNILDLQSFTPVTHTVLDVPNPKAAEATPVEKTNTEITKVTNRNFDIENNLGITALIWNEQSITIKTSKNLNSFQSRSNETISNMIKYLQGTFGDSFDSINYNISSEYLATEQDITFYCHGYKKEVGVRQVA